MSRLAILILFSYGMLPTSSKSKIDWDFLELLFRDALNAITAALYTFLVILIAKPAACCCLAFYTYTVGGYDSYPEYKFLIPRDGKPLFDLTKFIHEVQVGEGDEAEQDEQDAQDELELSIQDVMPPTLEAIDRFYPKTLIMTKYDVMEFSVRGMLHMYCHIHGGASNGY